MLALSFKLGSKCYGGGMGLRKRAFQGDSTSLMPLLSNLKPFRHFAISFTVLFSFSSVAIANPLFIDRAPELGIEHIYAGGWEHFVGGGVAVFDCDADHLPDLFVAGGENPAMLLRNTVKATGDPLAFQKSDPFATPVINAVGAYPLDVDSDGILDLFVLRVGENQILKGLGDCRFEQANELLGFDGADRWSTAFSATWEGGAALPTLAVGNYVDRDDPDGPFEACDQNKLFRPAADGYGTPMALKPGFCTLSMLISDWGRTGNRDLRISNDRHYYVRGGSEQLLQLDEVPHFYDTADGWAGMSIWGMGIASRDLSGDGIPEIFLTSMGDQKLITLAPGSLQPAYQTAPYERGTTAHIPYTGDEGRPSSGWHAAFGDINNDGLDDLFIAKGNVDQMPDSAMHDPNNLLIQQPDGTFVETGGKAGLASGARGRGAGLVDLNLDGKLDIVVVNRRAHLEIYENRTADTGNWIKIEPRQNGINSAAVGAWIEVKTGKNVQAREITVGGGHASGQSGFEHFGIGDADSAIYRVIWPDGMRSDWYDANTNQHIVIKRRADGVALESF